MASWGVKRAELSTAKKLNKTAQCSELVTCPQFAIYHVGHSYFIMEKEFKNGKLSGYKIGKDVLIHSHINDPESWFLTIRPMEIFGKTLCSKSCTEPEIARYINLKLHEKLNVVKQIISDVVPFI